MQSLKFLDRRAGYSLAAFSMLLAMIAPGLLPALASADALTDRSITLSSNAASATNVSYQLDFTPVATAGAMVVDFCNDSPVIGQTCTTPTGFSTTNVGTSTGATTAVATSYRAGSDNGVLVTKTMTADVAQSIVLTGIDNPTVPNDASNGFYVRLVTFTDGTDAASYDSSDPNAGSPIDTAGVALSINNAIGVSGAVSETLTFCVASSPISANCGDAASNPPSVSFGSPLTSNSTSSVSIFTQLSSNAKSGVVVNMKSNATGCGGLILAGTDPTEDCFIGPAPLAGISAGEAYFGVRTNTSSGTSGTLLPLGSYNNTDFYMNYVSGDATGVTSAYGDPVFGSNNLPVDNQNMTLNFGASVSNTTPAGSYSADLSMIAVGKY